MSAAGFKYGALVFSAPDGPAEPMPMHGGCETFAGYLFSLFPGDEHAHWREWIGTVAWDRIRSAGRVAIARMPSAAPEVLDGEDQQLRNRMRNAWGAFLLTGATHGDAPAWIMSGQARSDASGSLLATIRSAEKQDGVIRPFYWTRDRYVEIETAALSQAWAQHGTSDHSWFRRWLEIDELLTVRAHKPPILGYALLAYWSAWTRPLLEFSLPEFVRAAEGLIALPPRTGRALFRDRALLLAPSLRADPYVGADVADLLLKLYDLRSDCVHGKVPFLDMRARGPAGEDEAAQLNYVAEVLARETLLLALHRPEWSVFADRYQLQRAWDAGAFP